MPESRSDLLKISPELISGRMWHDPQNCSFPELEESVSILSKVHPLQPEEKKVRQKTSTVAQMTSAAREHHSLPSGFQRGAVGRHYSAHLARQPSPEPRRRRLGGVCPIPPRGAEQHDTAQNTSATGQVPRVSSRLLPGRLSVGGDKRSLICASFSPSAHCTSRVRSKGQLELQSADTAIHEHPDNSRSRRPADTEEVGARGVPGETSAGISATRRRSGEAPRCSEEQSQRSRASRDPVSLLLLPSSHHLELHYCG